jgi:uncharacterized membrane protein YeaQ/YmgE (transglycosylase-associated protein family)
MQGMGLLASVLVGAMAGWAAGKIMRADHGLLTMIIVGIFGALIGNGILTVLVGTTLGGWIGQMIVGAAGACLLIWGYRVLRSR